MKSPSGSTRRRGLIAAVTTFAIAVTGFAAGASAPAHADVNTGIVLSDASFKHVNDMGQPVTWRQEVYNGDFLEFTVNYDASGANVKPGDSFTVALPPQLDLRDTAAKKELKTSDGVVAGECTLNNTKDNSLISCVFTDAIANKIDIKGGIKAHLWVEGTTDTSSVNVDLNGSVSSVILPYDKPIVPRPTQDWKARTKPAKYSSGVSSNSTGINWGIAASGAWLTASYPNGTPVVIQDNFTPGVMFPSSKTSLYRVDELCQDPAKPHTFTTTPKADATGMSKDGFTLKLDVADTHNLTVTANGPWKSECEYVFQMRADFAGGATINKNYTYSNSATFTGVDHVVSNKRTYYESFEGTISYRDGYGGFKVTKLVLGDDNAAYADKEFTVSYECTDGQKGTTTVSQAGGVKIIDKEFYKGTECTVTESGYERDGYDWSGEATHKVTIVAGETAQVDFVNTYTKRLTPVVPAAPDVKAGVCVAGSTKATDPTVERATTAGITYGEPAITTEGTTATVTVTATPAEGYVIKAEDLTRGWVLNSDGTATYTTTVDQPKCDQVVTPVAPTMSAGVCEPEADTPTAPSVTAATTEGITYEGFEAKVDGTKVTFTGTAKANAGYRFDKDSLPTGWTFVDEFTATFSTTEDVPTCLKPVTVVSPEVSDGVCVAGSTTPTDPTVTVATTEGVAYGTPQIATADGKVTITVSAKADEGYQLKLSALPEGWTKNDDGTATYTVVLDAPKCDAAVAPVTPTVDAGTCQVGDTTPTEPVITPATTEGVTYEGFAAKVEGDKVIFTGTAKANAGYTFDKDYLPTGWTLVDEFTATFEQQADAPACLKKVVPAEPKIQAGICKPGTDSATPTTVVLPSVPGLSFDAPKVTESGSKVSITVVGKLEDGYYLGDLPSGWTKNDDGTVTFSYEGVKPDCVRPKLPKTGS